MERMDPRAEYEVPHGSLLPALGSEFKALVVIGMHAKSGTPRAFLEHTSDPAWHRYMIGGVEHGEFALRAFAAGAHGVPTVFVSGDRAAIDEACALVPDIEGEAIKEGLARGWRRSLAPAAAHGRIRDGVARAITRKDTIRPSVLDVPVIVRIKFNRCSGADAYDGRTDIRRGDGFTIEWTACSIDDLVRM